MDQEKECEAKSSKRYALWRTATPTSTTTTIMVAKDRRKLQGAGSEAVDGYDYVVFSGGMSWSEREGDGDED